MSGAVVVRRFTLSEMDKLAKKKAQEVDRNRARAKARDSVKVPALMPRMPPVTTAPVIPIAPPSPAQIEESNRRSARATVHAMIEHETSKPKAERLQLFEAYLELCLKVSALPDSATVAAYERFTRAQEREARG